MSGSGTPSEKDAFQVEYEQVCASFRAIDDFRVKLLAFLPLVSGAGGILLLKLNEGNLAQLRPFLFPIGLFGLVTALGLFLYEWHCMRLCDWVVKVGAHLEMKLSRDRTMGLFSGCPKPLFGLDPLVVASFVVYPAVAFWWFYIMGVGLGWWGPSPPCLDPTIVLPAAK